MSDKHLLTILITTLDEEDNIKSLVNHLGSLYPVVVVDSGSTDNGPAIVESTSGWTLVRHPYLSQGEQLNWSLSNVVSTDWVFILDADERFSGGLCDLGEAFKELLESGKTALAFKRQNFFGQRRLKHGGFYPDWQVRLMPTSLRYEVRPVHSHVDLAQADICFSTFELIHQTYTNVEQYVRKLGSYLVSEALSEPMKSSRPKGRRLRSAAERFPFPGFARFLYSYILLQGFRDGRLGFYLALWAGFRANVKHGRRQLDARQDLNTTLNL